MATPSIKRKTVVTDPEGNKITTKTRKTNLFGQKGSSKTIIKYADPVSSGKKRDVKYTDAPVPSDEELGIKEKGGVTKMKTKKYAMGGTSIPKAQLGRFLVKERPISDLNNAIKIADNTTVKEKKSGKSITKNHRSYMQTNGETANFKSRTVRNADGSVKKKNGWTTPIVAKQKRGGATKMKKYAMGGSALRPATDKANRGMYQMGGRMNNNPKPMPKPMPERKPRQITMDEKYGILGDYGPKTEADTNMSNYIDNVGIAPIPGRRKGGATKMYKTGGMVNSNSKITAAKKATGSVGGITKAISKVAVKAASPKGRVGGTSTAPKKALPKAQMGAIVNGPKSPGGKPKAGGAILKSTSKIDPIMGGRVPKSFIEKGKPKAGGVILKKIDPIMGGRIPKVFIEKGKPKAGGLILKNMSKAKMGGMKGKSC